MKNIHFKSQNCIHPLKMKTKWSTNGFLNKTVYEFVNTRTRSTYTLWQKYKAVYLFFFFLNILMWDKSMYWGRGGGVLSPGDNNPFFPFMNRNLASQGFKSSLPKLIQSSTFHLSYPFSLLTEWWGAPSWSKSWHQNSFTCNPELSYFIFTTLALTDDQKIWPKPNPNLNKAFM